MSEWNFLSIVRAYKLVRLLTWGKQPVVLALLAVN